MAVVEGFLEDQQVEALRKGVVEAWLVQGQELVWKATGEEEDTEQLLLAEVERT